MKETGATLKLVGGPDDDPKLLLARAIHPPGTRHAHVAANFGERMFGAGVEKPDLMHHAKVFEDAMAKAESGDKTLASRMLTAQAMTLDGVFTEMMRIGLLNLRENPDAAEQFMRVGLKAQTASRSTLEALTKLHQPREQIVKHINVNEGGQAVIADELHQHREGGANGNRDKPAHDQYGESSCGPALLGKDPEGNGVPITSDAREKTVSAPRRRSRKRCAAG